MFFDLFKGNSIEAHAVGQKNEALLTSEKIIDFLIANVNRQDLIKELINRYESIKKLTPNERQDLLIPLYFSLEDFIANNQPLVVVKAYRREEIREEIKGSFRIDNLTPDFRIVFLPDNEKWFFFFKKGTDDLAGYIIKHLGENRLSEVTKSLKIISGPNIEALYAQIMTSDAKLVHEVFTELYLRLFNLIVSVWDLQTAENILLARYNYISTHYSNEFKWDFLKICPPDSLKEERLKYLSHTQLEDQVKAQTKELSEEASRLHAALENMSIGVVMCDIDGKVISINSSAKVLLAIKQPLNAVTVLQNILPFSSEINIDIIKKISESQKVNKTLEVPEAELGQKILRLFISPVITPENRVVIGSVIVIQDITEERLIERAKDEVFTIASHELRTPLTAIRGYASLLDNELNKLLPDPRVIDMVKSIENASDRLIQIVNDFLDISRMEQGKISFEKQEFKIVDVVNEVFQTTKPLSDKRGLYLKVETSENPDLLVRADPGRTKQAILNLVGNAIKFTEKGGITVAIFKNDHEVILEVRDTGKGVDPKRQNLLFRKFQQAGESLITRDSSTGTGLGLYITKLIVNSMGGTVYLKNSIAGQGSVFVITIPVANTIKT